MTIKIIGTAEELHPMPNRHFLRGLVGTPEILKKLDQIQSGQENIMSQITDWATKEQADLTAIKGALDGIVVGVAALDQLITNFQTSTGSGLSAEDQAALDSIAAASDALVVQAQAISVAAPQPPSA